MGDNAYQHSHCQQPGHHHGHHHRDVKDEAFHDVIDVGSGAVDDDACHAYQHSHNQRPGDHCHDVEDDACHDVIEVGTEVVEDDTHLGEVAAAPGVDLQHAYGGKFADGVPVPDDSCAVALADDSCAVALAAAAPDD